MTSVELKKTILEHGNELLNNPIITEYVKLKDGSNYYNKALSKFNLLKDFEFSISVAAEQSAGKTSILNTLLGFPLLPVCTRPSTCVPTIIKYGKEIRIEISSENDKPITLSASGLNKDIYNQCLEYFHRCITVVGLDNPLYFLNNPRAMYPDMTPALKDLHIDYNNPKHIAMLVLNILCLYMDQEQDEKKLDSEQKESRKQRKQILKRLGLKNTDDYTVIVHYDSPVLENGLVFYDLPGLSAAVTDKDGVNVHERITINALRDTQAMLFVFTPEIKEGGGDAIEAMLGMESIKDLAYKHSRFIPVVNKIDAPVNKNAISDAVKRAEGYFLKYELKPNVIHKISTRCAESRLVDIGGINPISTIAANDKYESLIEDGNSYDVEEIKNSVINKLKSRYENKSNYTEFINGLEGFAKQGIFINTIDFVTSLQQLLQDAVSFFRENISISEEHLNVSLEFWYVFMCFLAHTDDYKEWKKKLPENIDKTGLFSIQDEFNNINNKTHDIIEKGISVSDIDGVDSLCDDVVQEVEREISRFRSGLHDISDKFETNFIPGDIVLYRGNQTKPVWENIAVWEELVELFTGFTFKDTSNYFKTQIRKILEAFIKNCNDIELKVTEINVSSMEKIIKNFDKYCVEYLRRLSDDDKIAADKIIKIFRDKLESYKEYVRNYKYDNQEIGEAIVKKAIDVCSNLSAEMVGLAKRKLDKTRGKGRIFKSVDIIKPKVLKNTINSIKINNNEIRDTIEIANVEEDIFSLFSEAKNKYEIDYGAPMAEFRRDLEALSNQIKSEIDEKGKTKEEIEHLRNLLTDVINLIKMHGIKIDDHINDLNEDARVKNEIMNLRDRTFADICK